MKGQVWSFDFIVGIIIVTIVTSIFLIHVINQPGSQTDLSDSFTDAMRISESLLTPGVPDNWSASDVIFLGVVEQDATINQTKMEAMYNMTLSQLRQKMSTASKFNITLLDNTTPIGFSGKDSIGYQPSNTKKVASISRLVIYNQEIVELRVLMWQ